MNVLLFCVLGQMVSFNDMQGYATVIGTPEQQVCFYEVWRDYVSPAWRQGPQEFWVKEWARVQQDARSSQRLMYSTDKRTRAALIQTILFRGYTVRFEVIVKPFGSFWLYYNSAVHALLMILGLCGIIGWMQWRKRKKRCGSGALTATS